MANLYDPHPMMIDSGTFWRCDHGHTGLMEGGDCAKCLEAKLFDIETEEIELRHRKEMYQRKMERLKINSVSS